MIIDFILGILGTLLFFLPGIFLSYLLFSKLDIIERAVYSIILNISISMLLSILLFKFQLLSLPWILFFWFLLALVLGIAVIINKGKYQTKTNKDIWYLVLFTLIGAFWRILFLNKINNFGDAYAYAGKFAGAVPNLGFYTGMARDHSNYFGSSVTGKIFYVFSFNNQYLSIFLITFVFLGLIYIIFKEYRSKKIAYLGVALMSFGPIEIFHSTLSIIGHPLSYIALFLLFLFFKIKNNRLFWVVFLLAIAMALTYYTSSVVLILTCIGFISAIILRELFNTRSIKSTLINSLKNKKLYAFALIAVVLASYLFVFSNMSDFTSAKTKDTSNIKEITKSTAPKTLSNIQESTRYKDPSFLGLSAIRWQVLFFLLSGMTFMIYMIFRRDFNKKNIDLLVCLIPVAIVSFGFLYVSMPVRAFDYFAFFGLLVIRLPKRYLKTFFLFSLIFILVSGFYLSQDKRIFLDTPEKEIEGARWIKNNLQGRVFSDQTFVNQLVLTGHYGVTGASDEDPLVKNLFYQKNNEIFLKAMDVLKNRLAVDYIVLTKRMREKYILMLNYPQKALINPDLYEDNFIKIYDNGDVRIYKITPWWE